ncbi:MAG: polysaccharide biosynthesis tyrosine autokinase [Bacteroidota bacterium]|nr:polysaccharide biosynthesis tyrosine autokinase [Bacteroidota bacterium]
MNQNKIPVINQKFDFFTFIKVFKKSLWIIGILLTVGLIIGFLYIRYTPPVYQASAVLQVRTQNKTNEILGLEEMYETGLDPVIELLRSHEFLKRCFVMLPLDISYYKEGTFLSYELYKTSPFEINYQISKSDLLNTKINLHFNKKNIRLTYPYKGKEHKITLAPNQWTDIPGGRIKIKVSDYDQISFYQNQFNKGGYYFTINDENSIINNYSQRLNINILNKSAGTIRISFEDKNARKTADIVNTISTVFLKYEVEKKKEGANNIIDYIDKQLGIVMNQMDSTETKLNKFQKDNRLTYQNTPPLSGTKQYISRTNIGVPNIATRISDFQNELINLEFEISTLIRISKQISSGSDVNIYELMAMLSGTRSEDFMKSMLNSMMDLYNERNMLLNDVTEDNYKIKTIDKQIQTKKEQIIDYINTVLAQLEQNKENYENKISELEAKAYNDSSFNDIEQARLERLFSINENFYHQLIQKKAEYMISQAGYVSDNIILESATVPQYRIKPSRKKIYIMVILITAFIGFLIILVRYLFYNKISTVQEISTFTDIPVIGAIPLHSGKTEHSQLVVHKNPKSVLTESFRNIRSNMAFLVDKKSSSMITISSTVSGEGKTFIAINLGGILAMANKKVILLDLDLRKPRLHKSFGFDNNNGISTILIGKHSIDECIHGTEIDNLEVISSGPIPPNPSELILTKKYNQMLDALKKQYDYIVVDTPPVGIVTDAIRSFQDSDYAFYITRADHSPRTFISYINNLAESKSLTNLSLVLNGMDESSGKYGYGYGYHYGYSYGYGQSYGYRDYVNTKDYYDDPNLKKRKITLKNLFRRKRNK